MSMQFRVNSLINSLSLSKILLCEKCLNGVNLSSLMKVSLFNLLIPTAPTVAMGAGGWLVCQQDCTDFHETWTKSPSQYRKYPINLHACIIYMRKYKRGLMGIGQWALLSTILVSHFESTTVIAMF